MNKKFFLSVFLLGALTLSSGVLTSCIDNDEPEGITTLRSAKAELLRAKAAVELANAKVQEQEAARLASVAAVNQAYAAQEQARVKYVEAEAQWMAAQAKAQEIENAYQQAKYDEQLRADKAKADEEVAEAEKKMEQYKLDIEIAKAAAEAAIADYNRQIAESQKLMEAALRDIELAKATLTTEQQGTLTTLQNNVTTALTELQLQMNAVETATHNLLTAEYTKENYIHTLKDSVAMAESKLAATKVQYDVVKKVAADLTETAWEKEFDEIEKTIGDNPTTTISYNNKTGVVGNGSAAQAAYEFKLAADKAIAAASEEKAADEEARLAYVAAQQEYNYLANESKTECFSNTGIHDNGKNFTPTAAGDLYGVEPSDAAHESTKKRTAPQKYGFDGAYILLTNSKVISELGSVVKTNLDNNEKYLGFGQLAWWNSNAITYDQFKDAFQPWSHTMSAPEIAINAMYTALDNAKVTNEEIEGDACIENYEKALADADSVLAVYVKIWEAAHKTYSEQKVEKSVSTDAFKAAIKLYNDNIDALEAAVKTYNEAWDAAFVSQTDIILAALKDAYMFKDYKKYITGAAGSLDTDICAVINTQSTKLTAAKTIKDLEVIVDFMASEIAALNVTDYNTAAKVKAAALKYAKKEYDYAEVEDGFKTTAETEALNGVTESNSVTSGSTTATFATKVLSVNEVKAVSDAKDAIFGLKGIIVNLDNPTGYDNAKKAYTGSYYTISAATTKFEELAKKNSEKLTSNATAAIADTKIAGYTGVGTYEYIGPGAKTDPKLKPTTVTQWTAPLCTLNTAGTHYVAHSNKLQVVRTKVSDEAIAKMTAVEFNSQKAAENWINASATAFGTSVPSTITVGSNGKVNETTNARHTELKADMVNDGKDENGYNLPTLAGSKLGLAMKAAKDLEEHEDFQAAAEELKAVRAAVDSVKTSFQNQIAVYAKAVADAKTAMETAKTNHLKACAALEAVAAPYYASIDSVVATVSGLSTIKDDLKNIYNAYYFNLDLKYIDRATNTEKSIIASATSRNFKNYEAAVKALVDQYEDVNGQKGYIHQDEDSLETAKLNLKKAEELEEYDEVTTAYAEYLKLQLTEAQQLLEVRQAAYDIAVSLLEKYIAAIAL